MGVFLCLRMCLLFRFLQTAILITELTCGRMTQVRHSQDAAVELTVCTDSAPHRAALEQYKVRKLSYPVCFYVMYNENREIGQDK